MLILINLHDQISVSVRNKSKNTFDLVNLQTSTCFKDFSRVKEDTVVHLLVWLAIDS